MIHERLEEVAAAAARLREHNYESYCYPVPSVPCLTKQTEFFSRDDDLRAAVTALPALIAAVEMMWGYVLRGDRETVLDKLESLLKGVDNA